MFTNAGLGLLAQYGNLSASAEGSGFHAPSIEEFFPEPFLFAGTPFAMNRVILVRLISVLAITIIFVLYAKRAKLIPGRVQLTVELLLEFVQKQIGDEILGKDKAPKYMPMLATLFIGILFMNITGILPGLQIASTSVIGMPLIYALFAYFGFIIAGIKSQGFGHFFKAQLMPAGVPKPIYIIMTPIEFISTFIVRPATLVVRLLANMVSGHLLLVLCFSATHALYLSMGGATGVAFGSLTLFAGIAFIAFELLVAVLQAYIFALLAAVYISLSIEEH